MSQDIAAQHPVGESIAVIVSRVRRRMRRRHAVHAASIGAAAGCFTAAVLAGIGAAVTPVAWPWLLLVVVGMTSAGGLIGFCLPVSPARAARRIDSFYAIKDRAITAMQFESDPEPVRQMQVDDARRHLRQVRAEDCVPIEAHRPALFSALAMASLAVGIVLFAEARRGESVEPRPVALAVDQASLLRETMLPEIQRLRDAEQNVPEIGSLADRLEELIDEMEAEAIDERDLMAKLSEMEQAVAEARDAMRLEMTDAQLKGLAEALRSSEAMKRAAAAIEDERYDEASEELEAIDPNSMSDKERRGVSDDLKKFLSKLPPGQKGKLSDAAGEIREGLEKNNDSQCKDGLKKLAGLCKKQGNCKKIGECMTCQLNRLAACKGACRGGKNGGNNVAKSDSPSDSWGTGASGNPNDGDKTELDSNRQQEPLSGVQGDGPSESEVIEAPEGEQSAARAYARRYQKFRSEAEAVLDSEPLPLGHRDTVRRYFENIRPDNGTR